mgnify:CR=1 FL=1
MYVHYIAGRRDQCASGKIFAETGRQFEKEERERSIISGKSIVFCYGGDLLLIYVVEKGDTLSGIAVNLACPFGRSFMIIS